MSQPRSLTITVEAISEEHMRKLLELALFELSKVYENTWDMAEGESVPLAMAGDMGSYKLEYQLGSYGFIAAHKNLIEQGYSLDPSTHWITKDYNLYRHAEKPPLRLYLNSGLAGEHSVEVHSESDTSF